MSWSFGCITDGKNYIQIKQIIDSIRTMNIPKENYEIIICGGCDPQKENVVHIPFKETTEKGHITKKKNLIFKKAKFDNISICHDYLIYDSNFHNSFESFNSNWDVCVPKIKDIHDKLYRSWTLFDTNLPLNNGLWNQRTIRWLSFDDHSQIKNQYISGAAYCVKKDFALKYPLDESLMHMESEDVEWSLRCRQFWNLKCNPLAILRHIKEKSDGWPPKHPDWDWKLEYEKK